MHITIIGAGNIGGTLGKKWAAAGHTVTYGVRDSQAEKVQRLLAESGATAAAAPIPAAAAAAELILFAVPGRAMAETAAALGAIDGKILIDASNNINAPTMHSLAALRQHGPSSPLFRAFSNLGWENFAEPRLDGQSVDLFYCGDAGPAQERVHDLISAIGLHPVYIGGVDQAATIDALTRLWFALALQQGRGRRLAFKMIGG